jgi:hypothetical protein
MTGACEQPEILGQGSLSGTQTGDSVQLDVANGTFAGHVNAAGDTLAGSYDGLPLVLSRK